jgi:hypothetical protein
LIVNFYYMHVSLSNIARSANFKITNKITWEEYSLFYFKK